jgi:hypothetical protein
MNNRPLSQLQSLNTHHAERVLSYLLSWHNVALNLREMLCLHVLIEVEHVLKYERACVGGALGTWKHGPVCKRLHAHLKTLDYAYREGAKPESNLIAYASPNGRTLFVSKVDAHHNRDDLSDAELECMEAAFNNLREMPFEYGRLCFRGTLQFICNAWKSAYIKGRDMCWYEILDEYQNQTGEDISYIKSCVGL